LGDLADDRCVVDLSDEHRGDVAWIYGLCEFNRDSVPGKKLIANPGCYPTATLLALVPFARAGLIEGPVIVDAMSGTSGAGRKGEDHLLHASLDGNVTAYGSVTHRHIPEMERGLASYGRLEATVSFTPHLVPIARGLLVTARARITGQIDDGDALEVLETAYSTEPFVTAIEGWPSPKSVAGTNRAVVSAHVDERNGLLVASAAIDNLGKGAAGQAIQNANLALGLGETTGLDAVGVWP
jgi:N-acetyl-gamma-glutamyl-phosphate reductase